MADDAYDAALDRAGEFRRLATLHTFGDSWSRTEQLDTRTRSLISVAIAATLGTHDPPRCSRNRANHRRLDAGALAPPRARGAGRGSRGRRTAR